MRGTELTTTTKRRHRYFLRRRLFRSLFVWSSFVFVYRGGGIIAKQNRATKGITERYHHHHPIFLCQKLKKCRDYLYYLDYEAFDDI